MRGVGVSRVTFPRVSILRVSVLRVCRPLGSLGAVAENSAVRQSRRGGSGGRVADPRASDPRVSQSRALESEVDPGLAPGLGVEAGLSKAALLVPVGRGLSAPAQL